MSPIGRWGEVCGEMDKSYGEMIESYREGFL